MKKKLTTESVTAILKDPTARVVWDTFVPGFGLRVRPAKKKTRAEGAKPAKARGTFILRYSRKGKTDRWLTFGDWGHPYTVDDGREWAIKKRKLIDAGEDPGLGTDGEIPTLEKYIPRYLELKASRDRPPKPRSLKEDEGNLARIVKLHPKIAAKQLHAITEGDIRKIRKERKDSGHEVSANRWLAVLRHLFNTAGKDNTEGWSLRRIKVNEEPWRNPCEGIGLFEEKGREPEITATEMKRLFRMLDRYRKTEPLITALIRLQVLTGARGSELRTARWDYHGKRGELHLPTSKEGGEKTIMLSEDALKVLDTLPRLKGSPFIFFGQKASAPLDQSTVMRWWRDHRGKVGLERINLHDFRHNLAAVLIGKGASLAQVGLVLGHKDPKTTMRYASLADEIKKKLAEDASAAISGKEPR